MRQTALIPGLLLSGALFSGGAAHAADATLMNLVMPDAKILAGVNATSVAISPLGQFIISKIGMNDPGLRKFIAATGFNPLQDISEVLAATAADPTRPGGLLLVRGMFPVDRITALAAGKPNSQVQIYGGATLVIAAAPAGTGNTTVAQHAVAFIGTSIAVAGDLTSVKAAIDRSGNANSIDPSLALKVNQLSSSEDEWLVSSTSVASLIPANAAPKTTAGPATQVLPLLKNIQSFNGGVKFGTDVALTGEATTSGAQNAAALQAVIQLGLTLASSNAANNPQSAQLLQMLQAMRVSTKDAAVELSLAIPEAQIETLVNSAPHGAGAIARSRKPVSDTHTSVRHP